MLVVITERGAVKTFFFKILAALVTAHIPRVNFSDAFMILVRYSRVLAGGILSRGDFSVKIFLSLLQGLREILFCSIGAGLRYGRIELHIAFYGIRRDDLG